MKQKLFRLLSMLSLFVLYCSTAGAINDATLNQLSPISSNHVFIIENAGFTVGSDGKISNGSLSKDKMLIVANKGNNTSSYSDKVNWNYDGKTYKKAIQVKGKARAIAFKVSAAANVTIYHNSNSGRIIIASSRNISESYSNSDVNLCKGTVNTTSTTFSVSGASTVMISSASSSDIATGADMYICGIEVSFSPQAAASIYVDESDKNLNASVNTPITLKTTVEGNPIPTIQWYKCDNAEKTNPVAIEGSTSATYEFTPTAAGTYYFYCVAKNTLDEGGEQIAVSDVITVKVLGLPSISSDSEGLVTITPSSPSDVVYYTTDGTVPSISNGTKYETPFVVSDGTIVSAVTVDGNIVSSVVSEIIYVSGITVAEPEINSFNGAVCITCSTPNSKIEYSTDGGITYKTYERSFLLTEDAEVKVRASREGCTTSEASANVTTIPAGYRTRTVRIGWGSCNLTSKANADDGYSTLTGKEDDADAKGGYILKLMNNAKEWSSSGVKIKILNGDEKTGIKLSNGAQNIIKLPKGVKATRLTLYSYCNYSSSSSTLGWKEINGVDYSAENAKVPMDRYSDYANKGKDPDIRVYPLDNVTGEISFTNSGNQLAFVIELDVIEPIKANVGATGYASYCSEYALDFTGVTALNAYVASAAADGKVSMTKVTQVPANTGLILKSASGAAVSDVVVPVIESANAVGTNLLVGTVAGATVNPSSAENGYNYLFGKKNEVVGFYKLVDNTYNLGVNKAYLHTSADITPAMNSAKGVIMDFGDGETTAISNIDADVPNDAIYYNLNGQRVVNPVKGVYILNGKKVMVK